MLLKEVVRVDGRFQRSARIDADLKGFPPLEGYVLQASVRKALSDMTGMLADSGQAAFTWTGPYGGGKSSAALLAGSLVAGNCDTRRLARDLVGPDLDQQFRRAFPETAGAWSVVAVTGRRANLRAEIAAAAADVLGWSKSDRTAALADDQKLVDHLLASAQRRGGVLLIIDELGKLLEDAAANGGDVHLLQDLAERGSRSAGRLVTIGILHQSFGQYGARLGREGRDEWEKIQGRYKDIPFLTATDETVSLIGRAIKRSGPPEPVSELATRVVQAIARRRPADEASLGDALHAVWPLHPITALLLGPLSRQRFAQNERSVFGFLSSAEPGGFQEHLEQTRVDSARRLFGPDQLWDYLVTNFGMALTDGAEGQKFSLAFEAVERAAARGSALHVQLVKTAALVEFFRNGSGLAVADDILVLALPDEPEAAVKSALADLVEWAIVIRQPRLGGYALFAGSDFDLEEALARSRTRLDRRTLSSLPDRVGFGAVVAKRHYFKTGALRAFEPNVLLVGEDDVRSKADQDALLAEVERITKGHSLILLISDGNVSQERLDGLVGSLARKLWDGKRVAAVGAAPRAVSLREAAAELVSLDRLMRDHPQLEGDRIARREIAARRSSLLDDVHRELTASFEGARWAFGPPPCKTLSREPLAKVTSAVCDVAYKDAPKLHSELLQRDRPSSSAMAAVRELGHAMIEKSDQAHLGIEGYPAERGLYMTVLAPTGLHRREEKGWSFSDPDVNTDSGRSLLAAWELLSERAEIELDVVFDLWAGPPFGLKRGVMPVLAMSYILARRSALAVYADGVFQPSLNSLFFDRLLQEPGAIKLKQVDRSKDDTKALKVLAVGLQLGAKASALEVASSLFQRFEALPLYSKQTFRLTDGVRAIRDTLLQASDPERLLFVDLPAATDNQPRRALEALRACEAAYSTLLLELTEALASALASPGDFSGLADRASQVMKVTGDLRFDAFAMRAAAFERGKGDIEGLASLLVHKPARSWTDREHDQALIELVRLGRMFRETEAVVAIRDRRAGGEAMAVVVGFDPDTPALIRSFEITASQRKAAENLAERLMGEIADAGEGSQVVALAALARAVQQLSRAHEAEFA
jgi:hypothetical protein